MLKNMYNYRKNNCSNNQNLYNPMMHQKSFLLGCMPEGSQKIAYVGMAMVVSRPGPGANVAPEAGLDPVNRSHMGPSGYCLVGFLDQPPIYILIYTEGELYFYT